jgi:structural maintenance of chromosome 3 (chondroitin sulfate proteoglycan 6)
MEEGHRQEIDGSNQQQKDFEEKETRLMALEQEINELKQHMELLLAEKRQLGHELESQVKAKAQIELRIKDHEENADSTAETKRKNQEEQKAIENEIQSKELELAQVIPDFQGYENEERQLREE